MPDLSAIARHATEVFRDSGAERRIREEGYTRVDPLQIASYQGIMVIRRPLEKLLGAFLRETTPGIIVTSERSSGLTHLTCAHELGHYFLGHESTTDDKIMYGAEAALHEREADWFAYCLLFSRATLAYTMKRKCWSVAALQDPINLYQLSLRLGVSYQAAAWNLVRLKLLSETNAQKMARTTPASIKRAILNKAPLGGPADVWLLDEHDRESILEPSIHDQIVFRLPNHASSGYLWSLPEVEDEGFQIKPFDRMTDVAEGNPLGTVNSMTTDHLLVSGHRDWEHLTGHPLRLALGEQRPWEIGHPQDPSMRVALCFEEAGNGLSAGSKRLLLQDGAATA
ncbi:MAG TPA: ImmA/IrrE family metallo-endopeptidase [Rhodanobacteraceae bacterium]|nr:ImmA/IrrE family metallo-endopeptidase [Rhodanobacteraceae bacterium]